MHWMADVSAKGMRQSYGMMVNYLYDPQTIDTNSENYVQTGSVAISADIGHLRKMKH
jgi:malonyl-CoA decarboxylase